MMRSADRKVRGHDRDGALIAWLSTLFAVVFGMVFLGGVTRLTGSGLSMVEWNPLMGAIPPISDADWQEVFARYQTSPQFQQVNQWMTLESFKSIFFWEYLHRLTGRLAGVVAFVPWLFFYRAGRLDPRTSRRVLVAIALGGLQGVLGWFMVKSGLADRPEVSHLRLASHLLLAIFIAQWILWILLDLYFQERDGPKPDRVCVGWLWGAAALLALQVLYGAFMAGTRAGILYPTFPGMSGGYAPGRFFPLDSVMENLVWSPHTIHYVHRVLALVLTLFLVGLCARLWRDARILPRWVVVLPVVAVLIQSIAGILTVVDRVPLDLAVLHQLGGFILASSLTLLLHRASHVKTVSP